MGWVSRIFVALNPPLVILSFYVHLSLILFVGTKRKLEDYEKFLEVNFQEAKFSSSDAVWGGQHPEFFQGHAVDEILDDKAEESIHISRLTTLIHDFLDPEV